MKHLLLLAAALIGCQQVEDHQVIYVWIQPEGFNQEQIQEIKHSFTQWEDALDGYVSFEYVDSKGYLDEIVVRATTYENLMASHHGRVAETKRDPWETGAGGGIFLSNDLAKLSKRDASYFGPIAMHEIGHALTLDHVETKDAIMFKDPRGGSKYITCNDVEQFCHHNNCEAQSFRLCYDERRK